MLRVSNKFLPMTRPGQLCQPLAQSVTSLLCRVQSEIPWHWSNVTDTNWFSPLTLSTWQRSPPVLKLTPAQPGSRGDRRDCQPAADATPGAWCCAVTSGEMEAVRTQGVLNIFTCLMTVDMMWVPYELITVRSSKSLNIR